MTPAAVGLILLSAVAHVYWNYQLKRSPAPGVCAWWIMALGALLGAPVVLLLGGAAPVPPAGWACAAGTGVLYAVYFSLIALSYRSEDLSRAYPIARGVAPVATALWGVLYHREDPSAAGWTGIAAITAGVVALALPGLLGSARVPLLGLAAAAGTGLCTSGYSAIDKEGIRHVDPLLYIVLTFAAGAAVQGLLLLPGTSRKAFAAEARRMGSGLWAAAAASMGGYLLVLWVLRTEEVSYVVTVRSVAVLLSVFAGTRLLGEGGGPLRAGAAALILLGISLIALWG